jgi:hypothetical protein
VVLVVKVSVAHGFSKTFLSLLRVDISSILGEYTRETFYEKGTPVVDLDGKFADSPSRWRWNWRLTGSTSTPSARVWWKRSGKKTLLRPWHRTTSL